MGEITANVYAVLTNGPLPLKKCPFSKKGS